MRTKVPLTAGTFFSLQHGYVLFLKDMPPTEVELGAQYNMSTMLSVWDLMHKEEHIGFFFESPFKTENKGSVLLTFMESKRGKATTAKLMIRHDNVMVFDVPGCGAMAISTKLSPEMASIIQEQ